MEKNPFFSSNCETTNILTSPQRRLSLYIGNGQTESKRKDEGMGRACREACLLVVFFKKTFIWEQRFGAQQAAVTGLIWFVLVVLEMLQL